MRQPLWLLNSSLLAIFVCALLFTLVLEEAPVTATRLKPRTQAALAEQETPKVSIARIYENDLFGTYVPQPKPDVKKPEPSIQPPQPPKPQPAPDISQPEPSFMPPLAVTLKGIIFTNHETESRAIIADNASKEETLYQVGDSVKDADIIHIGKSKVILMRANGQQETLFITEKQAQEDSGYPQQTTSWSNIIKQTTENRYEIDPEAFIEHVPHLAYLLDELDMTTAFENGKAVGARIGNIDADSLGDALGLQVGDIITHINDISTEKTQDRVQIYHDILKQNIHDTITVTLRRNNAEQILHYTLETLSKPKQQNPVATTPINNPIRSNEQLNRAIMADGNRQKETVETLQKPKQDTTLQRGSQQNALQRTKQE